MKKNANARKTALNMVESYLSTLRLQVNALSIDFNPASVLDQPEEIILDQIKGFDFFSEVNEELDRIERIIRGYDRGHTLPERGEAP